MKTTRLVHPLALTFIAAASYNAEAASIPSGLQADITQATLDSWGGWTEIHRSGVQTSANEQAIVDAATGDYLMMGVWDTVNEVYSILGAGETSAVTKITYDSHNADDNGNFNPNWSNGLNFYRTTKTGSWGFTTIDATALFVTDTLLLNGLQDATSKHDAEPELATGLSFRTESGDLNFGWAFNTTGNNIVYINDDSRYQRVFFTADATAATPIPSPTAALAGVIGLVGIVARRRRRA